jgi:hypothetical protein
MSNAVCVNPQFQSPLNRASKDKFILLMELPYILRKNSINDDLLNIQSLQISVHGSVVPTISVPSVELPYAGQSTNVSSHARPNYAPLTVNFIVDNDFKNYYVLWKWLDLLNTAKESVYDGTPLKQRTFNDINIPGTEHEYQTTFMLYSLNEYNQPTVEFRYHNSFITTLGAINYSYRDGTLVESSAEFQFGQLTMSKVVAT